MAPSIPAPPTEMDSQLPMATPPVRGEALNRTEAPKVSENEPERARGNPAVDAGAARSREGRATEQVKPVEDGFEGSEQEVGAQREGVSTRGTVESGDFERRVEAIRVLARNRQLREALRGIEQLRRDYPGKSLPRDLHAIERRANPRR